MGSCKTCGTMILFGGQREDGHKYCSESCLELGHVQRTVGEVPEDLLAEEVASVHAGACPSCSGEGPVDLHTSHRVTSMVIVTSWRSMPRVSCRSCGAKAKLGSLAYCLLLGWWGIPWGLLMTPVQVIRNLSGLVKSPDPEQASPELTEFLRVDLAARMVDARRETETETRIAA